MKFSLIHPSYKRPQQALDCIKYWVSQSREPNKIEYILSIDRPDAYNYLSVIPQMHQIVDAKVCVHPNKSVVPALNNGAKLATGDVLVYLSDDFTCPHHWDDELENVVKGKNDFAIWVNDGAQDRILTIHMLSKSYYQKLGYMYYPEYFSVYVDNDLTEQVKKDNVMVNARHLLFKHNHYSILGTKPDETYLKENCSEAYKTGKAIFQKRWPGVQC